MSVGYRIRHVSQVSGTECGVAAVAMLTGWSLGKARKQIDFPYDNDRTNIETLRPVLATAGLRLGRRVDCRDWHGLLGRRVIAMVAVNYTRDAKGDDRWHWIVFDGTSGGDRFLDPLRGETSRPGTRRLEWYHLVSRIGS